MEVGIFRYNMSGPDGSFETPEWKPESKVLGARDSQAVHRAALEDDGQGTGSGGGGLSKFSLERKPREEIAKPIDPDKDSYITQVIPSKIHWTYGPSGKREAFLRRHDTGSNPGPLD